MRYINTFEDFIIRYENPAPNSPHKMLDPDETDTTDEIAYRKKELEKREKEEEEAIALAALGYMSKKSLSND